MIYITDKQKKVMDYIAFAGDVTASSLSDKCPNYYGSPKAANLFLRRLKDAGLLNVELKAIQYSAGKHNALVYNWSGAEYSGGKRWSRQGKAITNPHISPADMFLQMR